MIALHRDPEGEKVFSRSAASQSPHDIVSGADKLRLSNSDQTVELLQTRVKQLELALSKHENTQMMNAQPMSKNTSKVTFSQDRNGQIEKQCQAMEL